MNNLLRGRTRVVSRVFVSRNALSRVVKCHEFSASNNYQQRVFRYYSTNSQQEAIQKFIAPYSTPELINSASVTDLLAFVYACFDKFDMLTATELYPVFYQCLAKCAIEGNVEALLTLGNMYAVGGLGVEKDIELSFKYYLEAAERGSHLCQYYVARYYFSAYKLLLAGDLEALHEKPDLLKDLSFEPTVIENEEGFVYLDEKAKAKIELSQRKQDKVDYTKYPGISKKTAVTKLKENRQIAMSYLKKAAEGGHPQAQSSLARYYLEGAGPGFETNARLAFEWLNKAAENNDAEAYYNLGTIYYSGLKTTAPRDGTENMQLSPEEKLKCSVPFVIDQNVDKAIECFTKAAELGDAVAKYWLGYSYMTGQHLDQNMEKGLELIKQSCELKHPQALYFMYLLYHQGNEAVPANQKLAEQMFNAAIDAQSSDAFFDLADRFFHGTLGKQRDLKKAAYYYEQAGRQGHGEALFCLGSMHYNGLGVERNLRTAYERYTQAVSSGTPEALVPLARMTMKGEGTDADKSKGEYLLSLARQQGVQYKEEDFL